MEKIRNKLACFLLMIFAVSSCVIIPFTKAAAALSYTADPEVAPWIASDKADYQPGSLVTLTGGNWTGDSEVKIVVQESSGKAQSWKLEKVAATSVEGLIELQFNIPRYYVPLYKVTATGLTTGRTAITTFTDSGGSYTLDFSAYDPRYYDFRMPIDYPTPPSGRASDPMPGANGSHPVLNSLEPRDLALGQIVPYEVEVTVSGSTAPENGVINFTGLWSTKTTNGSDLGFDPAYMVYAAFVDYGDPRNVDSGTSASARILSSQLVNPNTSKEQIKGTIEVSGLNNGDKIIVEIWVVLKSQMPVGGVSGNVHAELESAVTAANETINTGKQTVPLNQTGQFTSVDAEVSIVKADTPDPIYTGDTLTYSITVTNNSTVTVANGIIVKDTLDPNVTYVSSSDAGTLSNGVITWPAFALEPLAQRTFTVTVKVNQDAPTNIYQGTGPDSGSATAVRFTDADITNIVQFTMITNDTNLNNNVWQEPTNVLPRFSVTAYKVWVGGPSSDHQPVALKLYRQVGDGTKVEVTGVTPTITPSSGPADKFTYTWSGLPTYSPDLQSYTYTVDEPTVPEGYTKVYAPNNTIKNIYKPSLTILKVYGETPLTGAVFELRSGDASGTVVETITTASDGKATFKPLSDGTYWLVEIKPPSGYKWIDPIGPITVQNGTITGPEGFTLSEDGTTGNYIITVPNEPVRQLPATGGSGAIPFAAGGLGLMALAIWQDRRKKINKVESK